MEKGYYIAIYDEQAWNIASQSTIKMEKGYYTLPQPLLVWQVIQSQSTIKMEKGYYSLHCN